MDTGQLFVFVRRTEDRTEDALIADCVEAPAAASARRHSLHQSSVSCAEMGREMGAAPGLHCAHVVLQKGPSKAR